MTDTPGFSLEVEKPDNSEQDKIQKTSVNISKEIDDKLTDDEKNTIKVNKAKAKSEQRKIDKADQYEKYELSKTERKDALDISAELGDFLKAKIGKDVGLSTGKIETLPSGIDYLDAILGGGFGLGTVSVIAGNPGSFKSSLVGQIIGNSQKKFKGKMLSAYLDSETAMSRERLYQLGARSPAITPYSDITVEGIFKTIEALCSFKAMKDIIEYPSIVAWDSVANTTTDYEKADAETSINSVIGLRARILSVVLPRYVTKLRENNMSLIAVNQLRDKIAMGQFTPAPDLKWMGDKTMPGGNALKFNAFHLLLLKVRSDLKFDQWGFNGVKLEAKCIKNKLFTPNIPITMIVDFNTGISNFWTNFNFMKENKIITGSNWQNFLSDPTMKWQGTKGVKQKYDTEPEFKKLFDEEAKNAIQKLVIDQYQTVEIPDDLD